LLLIKVAGVPALTEGNFPTASISLKGVLVGTVEGGRNGEVEGIAESE
jgi:hypothetical protein